MTRPRGRASESTPGEDPLAGRHVPRSRRPATAREDGDDVDAPATDDLLDHRERRVSRKRKAPGPTRARRRSRRTPPDGTPPVPPTDPDS